MSEHPKRIAIIGAGPAGMIMYKKIVRSKPSNLEVHLFERKNTIGSGMPYSPEGAGKEHVTNISDNEMEDIVTSVSQWVRTRPAKELLEYGIDPEKYSSSTVLPRLLFGQYLEDQFRMLLKEGAEAGLRTRLFLESPVTDMAWFPEEKEVGIQVDGKEMTRYDIAIVCSGHNWTSEHEGLVPGYFDSPYPPVKLDRPFNHTIALRGSSLTAIDAIRTLARANGQFHRQDDGSVRFIVNESNPDFGLYVHSRNGLLPAVRFHMEDPLIAKTNMLTKQQIWDYIEANDGFLSLDFMFEKNFKENIREKDPQFYDRIKDMDLETFVDAMMELRVRIEPIQLLRAEYAEAQKSLRRQQSVHWKEMLVVLSYAMNYPAKYLSAEDMQRYQKTLAPLISIVIASAPQSSCQELLALNDAGVLKIIEVGNDSEVIPLSEGGVVYTYRDVNGKEQRHKYETFVDCIGQRQLSWDELPFPSLIHDEVISQAYIRFKSREEGRKCFEEHVDKVARYPSGEYYLRVPGLAINDYFQVLDSYGVPNQQIFMMAVPYIGGYNPDYSGLDFCEEASERIITKLIGEEARQIVA